MITKENNATVVELGTGDVIVNPYICPEDGLPAIHLAQSPYSGEVGSYVPEGVHPTGNSVIIVVANKESLEVLEWAVAKVRASLENKHEKT